MSYDLNGMLVVIDKAIDQERLDQAIALASETVDLAKQVLARRKGLENPSTPAELTWFNNYRHLDRWDNSQIEELKE